MSPPAPAAPAEVETQTPPPVITGYTIESHLGSGGFSEVFRARRSRDDAWVAVKLGSTAEDPEAEERFRREVEAMRCVGAPVAPALHEAGHIEGARRTYLVMDIVTEPSLSSILEESSGPMPLDTLFDFFDAILEALATIHLAAVIHRDLKPENIFVGGSPTRARVIDFGLAITGPEARARLASGAQEEAIGTPEYMSPEQCIGTAFDLRSDIYAVGAIFYEMLTGRPPFFGSATDVRAAQRFRRPSRPSRVAKVPPVLDEVLLRCLAKSPDERFPDAGSLRAALAFARDGALRLAPQTSPLPSSEASGAPKAPTPRVMPVLFFTSPQGLQATQAIASAGGELAHMSGGLAAAVFDPNLCEKPGQSILDAAEKLLTAGLATRALIDLARVIPHAKPGGKRRLLSAEFMRAERYPKATDPSGILIHARATSILPELTPTLIPGREGVFLVESRGETSTSEHTQSTQVWSTNAVRSRTRAELLFFAGEAAEKKRPTLVTVTAPPGYGKSFLAKAIAQDIVKTMSPVRLVEASGRAPLAGQVDPTARALLMALLGVRKPPTAETCRMMLEDQLGRARVDEVWPAVALAFDWLTPDAPELVALKAAPGLLPSMLMRTLVGLLHAAARAEPVVLVLDDLHLFDQTSLNAIELATQANLELPLVAIAFARTDLESARPSFGRDAGRHVPVVLPPLTRAESEDLCRFLLAPIEDVPARAFDRLFERTRGIPMLTVELIRGLRRDGLVRPSPSGKSFILATDELERMPEVPLVEWLADREIRALPEDLANHARLAALIGMEISPAEMLGVFRELELANDADPYPLDPLVALERLVEAGIANRLRNGSVVFRHGLLREVLSGALSEASRRAIHRAALAYYRSALGTPRENLSALAHHAEACGFKDEAADIYLLLGRSGIERHDYLSSEVMFGRALTLIPEEDANRRLAASRGRGVVRCRLARYEDAQRDLVVALAAAERLRDDESCIDILLEESTVLDWMCDYAGSLERAERARALLPSAPSPLNKARALLGIGRAIWKFNRFKEAVEVLEEARSLASPLGHTAYETLAITLMALGHVLPFEGRHKDAEGALDQLAALCESRGDRLYLASAINNRRSIWIAEKNVARAIEDQKQVLAIAQEYGIPFLRLCGDYNQGELFYMADDLESAWPHVQMAMRFEDRHPEIMPRPLCLLLSARLLAYEGRIDEARSTVDEITRRAAGGPACALVGNEQVLLDAVRLMIAPELDAHAWDAVIERSRELSVEQEPIEVVELRALHARRLGLRDEAIRNLERALEVAAKIPNIMEPRIKAALEAVRTA